MTEAQLSPLQVGALESISEALAPDRWILIGACAVRCRVALPRTTADVDLVVAAASSTVPPRLQAAGWTRHSTKLQTWLRGKASIDVIPATEADFLEGQVDLGDGFFLTVIGFDLAFSHADTVVLSDRAQVLLPHLPVLVLLKMISWLERPHDRTKDLGDLLVMLDEALPPDSDCRWDSAHPVGAANLDFDDQSPFFAGLELGKIADTAHLWWAKRFVDTMRDDNSPSFAHLVGESRHGGHDRESRVRNVLRAFERGLETADKSAARPSHEIAAVPHHARGYPFEWGSAASREALLHQAIHERRVVQFLYHGLLRVAEPHVLGVKNGRLQILTNQTGGSSSRPLSPDRPNWRRFHLDELSQLEVTNQSFVPPLWTGRRHSKFDRHIAVVRRA